MKTAALYIRVSTHHQEELSPDAQKRLLMDYATSNNLLISDDYIYIENGISGRKADKRPQFQKMISMAKQKNPPFQIILVWKFSRFARNQEESIVYKSLLKKNNIEIISISEPVIDGPFGSLIERIIEWMDEYYSIRLAGEVHRGMTENALRGKYQASPPLGYKIVHKGAIPVIVEEQAEIIKLIFDKYVNYQLTFFQIAKHLNNLGLKTKQGKAFERRSIEYILQNPMYKGYLRWNMVHNETNTIKEEKEWIIKKGQHNPIISEEVFDKAQERFKRESTTQKSRPVTEYKHWLSGIIKCAYCGRSMTASSIKRSKYRQFTCNGYSKGKCMKSNSISERKLVPLIIESLEKIIVSNNLEYTSIKKENKHNTNLFKIQLSRIQQKEKRIKAAYVNGVDTLSEYKDNKEKINKEKEELEEQINKSKVESSCACNLEAIYSIKDICKIIKDDNIDNISKNKAIKSITDKIIFNREEMIIDIYFYLN